MPSDLQPLQPWPDYLQASWLRCAHQTSATLWHPPHSAKGQTLQSLRQRKRDLLTTGESGCVLARTGHPGTLAELAALGFGPGAFFSEGRIGTNAINLAALEGVPLCVSGPQHFNQTCTPGTVAPVRSTTAMAVRSPSSP